MFTGAYAINPVNDEKIPIWIADYVLMGYGTGAIMAVPAHDERDYEFAKKFGLEIREVVSSDTGHREGSIRRRRHHGEFRPVHRNAVRGGPQGHRRVARSRRALAAAPSITSCATGCFRGSGIGVSRFRSFIVDQLRPGSGR